MQLLLFKITMHYFKQVSAYEKMHFKNEHETEFLIHNSHDQTQAIEILD